MKPKAVSAQLTSRTHFAKLEYWFYEREKQAAERGRCLKASWTKKNANFVECYKEKKDGRSFMSTMKITFDWQKQQQEINDTIMGPFAGDPRPSQ